MKMALWILNNTGHFAPTDKLFYEANILEKSDLYLFYLRQFMFQLNSNEIPEIYSILCFQKTNKTIIISFIPYIENENSVSIKFFFLYWIQIWEISRANFGKCFHFVLN